MKKLFIVYVFLLAVFSVMAEDEKLRIAVFDPDSKGTSIDEGTKTAVRELISSTLVNTGKYEIVERSLLEKVMQEQQFSQSGAVDDSQMTEIGKLAGANKVIVPVVTLVEGQKMLSVKMIDVKTARIDRQVMDVVNDVFKDVKLITQKLINADADIVSLYEIGGVVPGENELVFFLPPYERKDLKTLSGFDEAIEVSLNNEFIGSSTFAKGFLFRVKKEDLKANKKGEYVLKVGKFSQKIDVEKYNYFRFETASKVGGILGNQEAGMNQTTGQGIKIGGVSINLGNPFSKKNASQGELIYQLKIVLAEQRFIKQ